ncbi:MAG: bifunctional diguanylate cyclase/phosphodiesterase [Eubacteriales bacterium]
MNQAEQWELILKTNHNPCFIADVDTYEMIYVNDEYKKLLPSSEKIIGRKFYAIIPNDNAADFQDIRLDWENHDVIERQLDNRRSGLSFFVQMTLMKKENVVFGMMTPTEESQIVISNFEEAMSKCMNILGNEPESAMFSFCELLKSHYQAEQAYIYRFRLDTNTINCLALWCDDPAFCMKKEVQTEMDGSFLVSWLQNEHVEGIVSADLENPDFDTNSPLGQIMSSLHMKNVTLATVEDGNHKVVGAVGLTNRVNFSGAFDNRLLSTISRFVAQSVTKQVMDSSLFTVHHRDSLTGLYNRVGYARRTHTLKENPPKTLGLISMNINGLKNINDNLGNEHGDQHIIKSAKRIKSHFGYDIYRVSGDELIGIAENVEKSDFEAKVEQLRVEMRAEHNYDFSMGSSWSKGNLDLVGMLREADTIMYINKQEYYSSTSRSFDSVNNAILSDLLSYLQNDEFMIYLQPQVRLKDGSLHGAEALIRRFDKINQKMVFPDQFIPLYEQNSVIRHVDLFVVERVCQLLASWEREKKAIPISVNLSRVTLLEYGIVDSIVKICNQYKVPHSLVVIEVTERVGLIENDVPSALVTDFIDNGFTISLDDFGCAYSNIVTLAQIQVDEVKLDKSLVDNLTTNRKNHILVKNVLSMCDELEGMSTLAEGIEDAEQSSLLHELGCHLGQGYFYARPMPVADFEKEYLSNPKS